ncbi:hypothetical protein SUNI508_06852 [Seiridium unicorne]|uniref:Uncharacterized protein n=1 Tax=Seiridium unicorne TaxID=138068 RepID=A0ABR2UZH7_9PEZI
MQFTSTLIAFLAATGIQTLPSTLEARQARKITVQFYRDFCGGTSIGPPQIWIQRDDRTAPIFCDETGSLPHLNTTAHKVDCFFLNGRFER